MRCINCGRQPLSLAEAIVCVTEKNETQIFCAQCADAFGTCAMCQHNTPCAFQVDPDPTPQMKVLSRSIQQGNATFVQQIQVPNGDRIKKLCIDRQCKCYNGDENEPLCCRFGGCATCSNYCEIEQFKFG